MKKALVIIMILLILFTAIPAEASPDHPGLSVKVTHNNGYYTARVYYHNMTVARYNFEKKPKVKYVTHNQLTCWKLTHRKNKVLYIEVLEGRCLSTAGDGKIKTRSKYNYISYRNVPGILPGDLVRTYLIYCPFNNYDDDVALRYDQILS